MPRLTLASAALLLPLLLVPAAVAAQLGQMDVIRLLLERGADPAATNEAGLTAAMVAEEYGNTEAAALLRRRTP